MGRDLDTIMHVLGAALGMGYKTADAVALAHEAAREIDRLRIELERSVEHHEAACRRWRFLRRCPLYEVRKRK